MLHVTSKQTKSCLKVNLPCLRIQQLVWVFYQITTITRGYVSGAIPLHHSSSQLKTFRFWKTKKCGLSKKHKLPIFCTFCCTKSSIEWNETCWACTQINSVLSCFSPFFHILHRKNYYANEKILSLHSNYPVDSREQRSSFKKGLLTLLPFFLSNFNLFGRTGCRGNEMSFGPSEVSGITWESHKRSMQTPTTLFWVAHFISFHCSHKRDQLSLFPFMCLGMDWMMMEVVGVRGKVHTTKRHKHSEDKYVCNTFHCLLYFIWKERSQQETMRQKLDMAWWKFFLYSFPASYLTCSFLCTHAHFSLERWTCSSNKKRIKT